MSDKSVHDPDRALNEHIDFILTRMGRISEDNVKLADKVSVLAELMSNLQDRVIELQKWRKMNEPLYSDG